MGDASEVLLPIAAVVLVVVVASVLVIPRLASQPGGPDG